MGFLGFAVILSMEGAQLYPLPWQVFAFPADRIKGKETLRKGFRRLTAMGARVGTGHIFSADAAFLNTRLGHQQPHVIEDVGSGTHHRAG